MHTLPALRASNGIILLFLKKYMNEAGEIATDEGHFLFSDDLGSVRSIYTVAHNCLEFQFKGIQYLLLASASTRHTIVYMHTCRKNTYTHKIMVSP